jgi:kinesin family protein 18/19
VHPAPLHDGTVFAYGATGSGKTYTMVGEPNDPGMMLLSLMDIFDNISEMAADYSFEVTCSYLEVYNELIYDLLVKNSASLELREDPEKGAMAVGLKKIEVKNTDNVMDLLREGNMRRKTEPTEANAVSSRSHAVLEIQVGLAPLTDVILQ